MEFKGTKGEWVINSKASRNVKCNGITIANCSQGQSGDNEEEERANAQLIANAPKMLEMLKVYLVDLNNIIPPSHDQRNRIIDVEDLINQTTKID